MKWIIFSRTIFDQVFLLRRALTSFQDLHRSNPSIIVVLVDAQSQHHITLEMTDGTARDKMEMNWHRSTIEGSTFFEKHNESLKTSKWKCITSFSLSRINLFDIGKMIERKEKVTNSSMASTSWYPMTVTVSSPFAWFYLMATWLDTFLYQIDKMFN